MPHYWCPQVHEMYLMFRCIQKTIYNPRGPEKINKLLFAFYSKRSPDKNTYHLGGTWWCGENRPVGRVSLYCQGAGTGRPWPGLYWYPLVSLWTPSPACNNKVLVSKGNRPVGRVSLYHLAVDTEPCLQLLSSGIIITCKRNVMS